MTDQVANLDKENQINKMINESLTAELERYKERVAIFEQRINADSNNHEKLIDSQMDDLILKRNVKFATFQQDIDTLKKTLSKNVKEKESLSKTLTVFKIESKEKDVIAKEHDVISVINEEETLILEEDSRSKMLDKQNDPISIEKKIKIYPIDYSKLNNIKEVFGKCFVTKKELSVKTDFLVKTSKPSLSIQMFLILLLKIEAPRELPKCSVDKNNFEIQIKQLRIDNDQLLNQIMSQEIMHIAMNSVDILNVNKSCVNECCKCLELETRLLKKKDFIEKDVFDKLENSGENENALTFNQLFEINELKAQSQKKDTIIRKMKKKIKYLSGKDNVENVKKYIDEIKTINIELEHNQFDSIKKTRVRSKEHSDSLIAQVNAKSVENSDLNAQLQEKLDIESISHRLKNNKDAHEDYLKKIIENTDTLCDIVECARNQNPSEPLLDYACRYTKHIHELLVYVSLTCPIAPKLSEKLVAVTPMNKDKIVRFTNPITSSSNVPK
ncbi:hypothetical protein Tco_0394395 [Tanacetum coccineum]